ncbi:MAG TPA: hypothetical protein VFT01_09345, partial [Homoserinimonas sp.]|nr:hypothetical protein [Homoserinimonas sp.]
PYGSFYDFLLILAYLVVPFSTILLLDYYLRTRPHGQGAVTELIDTKRIVEWGFVAWVAACAFSSLFWASTLWAGPFSGAFAQFGDMSYLAGAIGAVVAYLALRRLPSLSQLLRGNRQPVEVRL